MPDAGHFFGRGRTRVQKAVGLINLPRIDFPTLHPPTPTRSRNDSDQLGLIGYDPMVMSWDVATMWADKYRGQHRTRMRSYTMDYMRQYYPVPRKRETTYREPEDEQQKQLAVE